MLGDSSVPKSSIIMRYLSGFFMHDLKLTIGVDFFSKTVFFEGCDIKLNIWDFGGEERFRFLLSQYCRGANGAILLYDITNRITLDHLADWIQIIRENAGDIPIILAGTNLDSEQDRDVSHDEGLEAARRYNLGGFIEVPPKTGQNVEELFNLITRLVLQTYSLTTCDRGSQIFNRCIYCGQWLHTPGKEYTLRKIKVKELKFCCDCFKKFKGKTLEKLRSSVVKSIERNIKKFAN